jgi:hypothetical protein
MSTITSTTKATAKSARPKAPKVKVGEAFTANDVQLANDPKEVETRTKAQTTTILLIALVAFYGVYIAHEWWVGHSFDGIGRFIENAIVMILGWCLGKGYSKSRDST